MTGGDRQAYEDYPKPLGKNVPITIAQRTLAEQAQWTAARDGAPQVRLVAGPGTGKSYTIEKRVADLLSNGATAGNVYVIEPNANPCIAKDDELAQSALKAGIGYPSLIRKVVNQALRRQQ